LLAWWLRRRSWQFQLILPNQVLFWVVIVVGFVGVDDFELNFATTITWFVWFSLVFVLIAVTGRGWCAVCPFGGLAEWIQRGRLWHGRGKSTRRLGPGRTVPAWLSRYGYVPTAFMFGLLTWLEEYFGVSDGSSPSRTSWTVMGIILLALAAFVAFDRRSFCRHLCPLGGLIGVLGAGAPVTGFRARERRVCLECTTRDCLHGNARAYGCPWFNWPGGSDSNTNCGLCGECFRACPSDNVGLFVDYPFAGLTRASDRRGDVAWTVAVIGGIVFAQHVRTAPLYDRIDVWSTGLVGLPHGPNPVLFALLAAACTVVLAGPAWVARALLYRQPPGGSVRRDASFTHRITPFRVFFLPLSYAAIPLLAADFVAVELLGFMQDSPKVLASLGRMAGMSAGSLAGLQSGHLLAGSQVVAVQLGILVVGTVASVVVGWRIFAAEVVETARAAVLARIGASGLMALAGILVIFTYLVTNGEAG
jgi:ferredoxin